MTLQQAIAAANANPGPNQINYGNIFGTNPPTAVLNSYVFSAATPSENNGPLPPIANQTVVIDGTTTTGLLINLQLKSAAKGDNVSGFDITTAGAANSIIRNFDIFDPGAPNNFAAPGGGEFGIKIETPSGGVALQNIIILGIDGDGVVILGSPNNTVGGAGTNQALLINANNGNGVHISGLTSTNNIVQTGVNTKINGNGNPFAGISANAGNGIVIDTGAGNNVLGGFTSTPVNTGNDIINNTRNGIDLNNSSGNRIQRNYIGIVPAGNAASANAGQGILVENGSSNNLIGGNDVPNAALIVAGNAIGGNTGNGIEVTGATSSGNQIFGNLIGINEVANTITPLPNTGDGILVLGAPNTQIGSTTTASNFIDDNNRNGIEINGAGTASSVAGTVIVNNRVGISSSTGNLAMTNLDTKLGNIQDGILVTNQATNITIGGGGTNAQNIIGDNRNGINIQGTSALSQDVTGVVIKGNWLGVNKLGTGQYPNLGNLQDGLLVQFSKNITIGGTQSLEGNKACQNGNGIHLIGSSAVNIVGNLIGPNFTGTPIPPFPGLEIFEPVFQAVDGILVEGSSNVTIGSAIQNGGNLISHNRHGINIRAGSSNVLVQNNRIGTQTDPTQSPDLGNLDDGIVVDASTNVTIGGTTALAPNVIAKNADGIQISSGATGVVVLGNLIRNNTQSGIHIIASSGNTIGGDITTARNEILNRQGLFDSTFNLDGIFMELGSQKNVVEGNFIGTDGSNDITLGNHGNGVYILGSSNNTIGGDAGTPGAAGADPGIGNTIAYNNFDGVAVVESVPNAADANGNTIWGNSIFSNGLLGIELNGTAGTQYKNSNPQIQTGANRTQNYPVLSSAESGAAIGTHILGGLTSTANHMFRIEFFGIETPNTTGNPPNYGQAKKYLGFKNVTTNGAGQATFDFFSPNIVWPAAEYVTATATDVTVGGNSGDTSAFSLDQVVTGNAGPATYVVTNDDGWWLTVPTPNPDFLKGGEGPIDLAAAINLANNHPGPDRIVFSMNPIYTITQNGATKFWGNVRHVFTNGDLPDITDSLILDGSPLAWPKSPFDMAANSHVDQINDNYTALFNLNPTHGIAITDNPTPQSLVSNPTSNPDASVLRHFQVAGSAPGVGVELNENQHQGTGVGQHAKVYGNANLQDMVISGWGGDGVRITNTINNIVGGSGATQSVSIQQVSGTGVNIIGSLSTGNLVQQTFIGILPTGGSGFGAGGNGIWIQGANNNTIGGFATNTGDQIQASAANGIYILNSSGTRVQRSVIGDPTDFFPNKSDGILVENSPNTLIGGVDKTAGNTIAGNTNNGIDVIGAGSAGLKVQSNQIGTTTAPNSNDGIFVNNVANVLIGSTLTAANAIDGNNEFGIELFGSGASGARIVNTSVGAGGGNVLDGIFIHGASTSDVVNNVVIGGSATNAGGTIAGNRVGVNLLNATNIVIQQYTISNNSEQGILTNSLTTTPTTTGILIGGTASALSGNVIKGNLTGVQTINSSHVTLQGNTIINNAIDGVIIDSTGSVTIGTPSQFGTNLIAGNHNGVHVLNGSSNFLIQNNIIGNGVANAPANTDDGIRLDGIVGATIGGTTAQSSNFVSGNRNGLHLAVFQDPNTFALQGSNSNVILQNVFGNSTENGILIEGGSNNTIGGQVRFGTSGSQGNVISSNTLDGIFIRPDFTNQLSPMFSNGNVIQGNFIGVNQQGTGNFGNGNTGVYIDGGNNNLVGGTTTITKTSNVGNIIANSGASGVVVVADNGNAVGNSIEQNTIFNSGGLAIELGSNIGLVTPNDSQGHADTSPNRFQNFPVIDSAEVGSIVTQVIGHINSNANRTYRIELFANDVPNPNGNPPGYGQAQTYVGSIDVTTDGTGLGNFKFQSLTALAPGSWISATATDKTTGDTSEMALSVQATVAAGVISGTKVNDFNGDGLREGNEPGLPGWVIDLYYNGDTNIDAKVTTDANGNYSFSKLTDGTYKLVEEQQKGWVQTFQPSPNPFQMTGELTLAGEDFGNFKLIQISGHKFNDLNHNGVQDPGEGPIANVEIDLYQMVGPNQTKTFIEKTFTDTSGNFVFQNVGPTPPFIFVPGTAFQLQIAEVVPAGFKNTTPNPLPPIFPVSGTNITGLLFGNFGGTSGGGGGLLGAGGYVVGADAGGGPEVRGFKADGTPVLAFFAFSPNFTGGVRVALGDINGDGAQDIICAAGAGGGPEVKVYDGNSLQLIRDFFAYAPTFTGGVYIAAADVNGAKLNNHAVDDIITGAGGGGGPHVQVFDGLSSIQLFSFMAYAPTFTGGVRVAGGDVNGDGFADIVVGAGPGGGPHVQVFSGATFGQPVAPTVLLSFFAYESTFSGGIYVATGKLDASGHADIITGPGAGRKPEIKAFNGGTQALMLDFAAFSDISGGGLFTGDSSFNTGVRVAAADKNGDGIDDIVAGPGPIQKSYVEIYNGTNGQVMSSALAFDPAFLGGIYVG